MVKLKDYTKRNQSEVISREPTSYGFAALIPRPDVGAASRMGILFWFRIVLGHLTMFQIDTNKQNGPHVKLSEAF